jgi:glycosyltransferase involved in cell wall biosynthesis
MTIGVKYIGYGDNSGYALAALAYVRALHNIGVSVWWQHWFLGANAWQWRPEDGLDALPMARAAGPTSGANDVPALVTACSSPIDYDVIVVQTVPEYWPRFAEKGKRLVGYTTWETDALPAHWGPLLRAARCVSVPSSFNLRVFATATPAGPPKIVPHIRRHAWSETMRDDAIALRLALRIPDDHFVFYTIGAWDPRKNLAGLIDVFASEFQAHERVSLVIKTTASVSNSALDVSSGQTPAALARAVVARVEAETGRAAAKVAVLAVDDMSARRLDAIHAMGDVFVSATHGEGWGLGAFEAATLGKPVLMTAWGGPLDYLGAGYPGLTPHRLVPVSGWVPYASYQPTQRWAEADPAALRTLMRRAFVRDAVLADAAARVREDIANRYAEPVVARTLLGAIDG